MRNLLKFGLIAFALAWLSACASFTRTIDSKTAPNPEAAYVYGRFYQLDKIPVGRLLVAVVINDRNSTRRYQIRFEEDRRISTIKIPPGEYVMDEIVFVTGDYIVSGRKKIADPALNREFQAVAGVAYYIGDWEAETESVFSGYGTTQKWNVNGVRNNYRISTEDFRSALPNLAAIRTESVFGADNPGFYSEDENTLLKRAIDAATGGQQDAAMDHLGEVLKINPNNAGARYLRGAIYAEKGKYDMAIVEMERAVTLDPNLHTAHFQLGLLQITQGNVEAAKKAWLPLEKLDANDPLLLFKQGLLHLADDEYDKCIDKLLTGIGLNTTNESLNTDMRRIVSKARQLRHR